MVLVCKEPLSILSMYQDPPVGVSNELPHTTYRLPDRAPRQEGPGIQLQHGRSTFLLVFGQGRPRPLWDEPVVSGVL